MAAEIFQTKQPLSYIPSWALKEEYRPQAEQPKSEAKTSGGSAPSTGPAQAPAQAQAPAPPKAVEPARPGQESYFERKTLPMLPEKQQQAYKAATSREIPAWYEEKIIIAPPPETEFQKSVIRRLPEAQQAVHAEMRQPIETTKGAYVEGLTQVGLGVAAGGAAAVSPMVAAGLSSMTLNVPLAAVTGGSAGYALARGASIPEVAGSLAVSGLTFGGGAVVAGRILAPRTFSYEFATVAKVKAELPGGRLAGEFVQTGTLTQRGIISERTTPVAYVGEFDIKGGQVETASVGYAVSGGRPVLLGGRVAATVSQPASYAFEKELGPYAQMEIGRAELSPTSIAGAGKVIPPEEYAPVTESLRIRDISGAVEQAEVPRAAAREALTVYNLERAGATFRGRKPETFPSEIETGRLVKDLPERGGITLHAEAPEGFALEARGKELAGGTGYLKALKLGKGAPEDISSATFGFGAYGPGRYSGVTLIRGFSRRGAGGGGAEAVETGGGGPGLKQTMMTGTDTGRGEISIPAQMTAQQARQLAPEPRPPVMMAGAISATVMQEGIASRTAAVSVQMQQPIPTERQVATQQFTSLAEKRLAQPAQQMMIEESQRNIFTPQSILITPEGSRLITPEIQITVPVTGTRQIATPIMKYEKPMRPPVTPPFFFPFAGIPPRFGLAGGGGGEGESPNRSMGGIFRTRTKYQPSLFAIERGIRGPMPRIITPFGIRPVTAAGSSSRGRKGSPASRRARRSR